MSDIPSMNRYRQKVEPDLLGFTRSSPSVQRKNWTSNKSLDALIISQSNPRKGGVYVRGGPFYVYHSHQFTRPTSEQVVMEHTTGLYKGMKSVECRLVPAGAPWARDSVPTTPALVIPTWDYWKNLLVPLGATGFARARPGNSLADAAVAAKELASEGLPTVPGALYRRLRQFRSLGKEYLNVVFGWQPFLNDVNKMVDTAEKMNQHLDQIARDHGRKVRRRRSLGGSKTGTSTVQIRPHMSAFNPSLTTTAGGVPNSQSWLTTETVTTERAWFVGAFRYYIPDFESGDWIPRARRVLQGAHLTPEVLWNALPWSWMIDWFTNYGDVLANISENAVGHPVAEYAFVMKETVSITRVTAHGLLPSGNAGGQQNKPYALESYFETRVETRTRVPATPYGFGVTFDSLSARQIGILAALGLSRANF